MRSLIFFQVFKWLTALDRINRELVFYKLLKNYMNGKIYKAIKLLYKKHYPTSELIISSPNGMTSNLGPISQRDLSPDLDLNLRLWS